MGKSLNSISVLFCLAGFQATGIIAAPADPDMMVLQQGRGSICTGIVRDASGNPVVGASVRMRGTKQGVITSLDGKFSLGNVKKGAVIEISSIGYASQSVTFDGASLNVVLKDNTIGLNEVVAIGYGYIRKNDLTGSVASIASKDLTLGGTVSNAAQALQGKISGVQIAQTSNAPGGSISVKIRGNNSISSTNEPLYVVDGFPTSDGLDIDPNDIASIEVLKDASATAIYGSRGANGVVLITTKKGQPGVSHISYNGYIGVQQIRNPYHFITGKEYMNLQNALYQEIEGQEGTKYGKYTPSQLESTVNTDWMKVCTQLGLVHSHNVSFQGGSEKTKVMASLGYFDQNGILKNTNFSRLSGRINVDQIINEYVKAGASAYAHREQSNYQMYSGNILNSNVLYSIMTYDPTVLPYNADGSYGRVPGGRGDNPLANLLERKNDETKDKLNGSVYMEIAPFKGLTARATAGVETQHVFRGTYLPASTYQGSIDKGVATTYDYSSTQQLFETVVNYLTTINKVHNLGAMVGYSYEKFSDEYRSQSAKGFSTDQFSYNNMGTASTITNIGSFKEENILISFFGRLNYNYKDKYLVTATVRRDGSSRFGANNRWGTFPSFALAWRLGEEDFIKNLHVFDNLKLRAGYGVTGNERIGDYASLALMSNTRYTFDGSTNASGTHLNVASPANSNLKWETTRQWNAGLDMEFLNHRLVVTLDAYWKTTEDLLLNVSMPLYSGFSSGQSNVGSIQNHGVELDITSHNFTGAFEWTTKFNISMNRNNVKDLGSTGTIYITSAKPMGNVSEEAYAIIEEGKPLGSLFGYKYLGVLQQNEKYAPQPNSQPGDPKFEDVNGDGKIDTNDRTIIGNANPDFIFGLTNTFAWKNFDLSVFFQGVVGNDLLNMTRMNLEWTRTTDALKRWTPENTNTDIPRNGFYYSPYGGYINSHFIENASFLRLKNITLGYTIPFKKVISSCRIYFSAENLFTVTNYSGMDPEVDTAGYQTAKNGGSNQSANAGAGLDFNSYPGLRTFTFGLNISF